MFKFLNRQPAAPSLPPHQPPDPTDAGESADLIVGENLTGNRLTEGGLNGSDVTSSVVARAGSTAIPETAKPGPTSAAYEGRTTSDFEPLPGVMGRAEARDALARVASARPRSIYFAASPRTMAHREALRELLAGTVAERLEAPAAVIVHDFHREQPKIIRLSGRDAHDLAAAMADAVDMLSTTVPAAFDSDSARVARLALDEEVRSGHDGAIDTLRRKAKAQNIGLLRTPQGYAVAPMHDGRVVPAEIFDALPASLKSDVETKLATFQGELATILQDRAKLQQDFAMRLRELDREVASLAVRAALTSADQRFAAVPEARAYLDAARADLTRNAALFGRIASAARAPVEIAHDQALARYRVRIITPSTSDGIETAVSLDAADLAGELARTQSSPVTPLGIEAGALTRAGNGLVLIDASDLLAQYSAWPLLKAALRSGTVQPVLTNAAPGRVSGPVLPVDCRLVVIGEIDEYVSWCRLDRDVASLATLIRAFEASVPLDTAAERRFARHIAALVAEEQAPPLDASALATLLADNTDGSGATRRLSTNLDPVRECIIAAAAYARAHDRQMITARDIEAALSVRRDAASLLDGRVLA